MAKKKTRLNIGGTEVYIACTWSGQPFDTAKGTIRVRLEHENGRKLAKTTEIIAPASHYSDALKAIRTANAKVLRARGGFYD